MSVTFPLVIACLLAALPLAAAPEGKPAARHVRLLALGESPPFRQEIRDNVRYELDPPKGSIPPREVTVGSGESVSEPMALRLGQITAPVKVTAGVGALAIRRSDDPSDSKPWLSVKPPETGDFLVYVFRDPNKKTWDDAVSLVVPDGDGTPAGTVRIANLFPLAVHVAWGGESLVLGPGKSILREAKPGAEIPFQILVPDESGALKRYYSGGVNQNQGERGFVTIYRADGFSPRRPVKVSMLREPVVAPPKEEKK